MMRVRTLKSDAVGAVCEDAAGDLTAAAYAHFAPLVRRRLAKLGVRDADLPDLCHEVFLVVHHKVDQVAGVERLDRWLRAICRRVAASYRRRSAHKMEILSIDSDHPDSANGPGVGPERREQLELVRQALNRLDDESRDLLALHDVGQMPLTDLARLVAHDRKTVRKRLGTARRRVSRLVCQEALLEEPAVRPTPPQSPLMQRQAAKGRAQGCTGDEMHVLHVSENRNVGVIGNVAIATWAGPVTPQVLDHILHIAPQSVEHCGGEIVYLALIEPTFKPPSLAVRQRVVEALETIGPYISAFAVAMLGGGSSISAPI